MATITINEVSQNYTYNVGNSSYATVALPITSCWGPGFEDVQTYGYADDETLESVVWSRFKSNQEGLESFVSTFRGPVTQYIQHRDYSYQMAMTLLTSGYDILVCRLATGASSQTDIPFVTAGTVVTGQTHEEDATSAHVVGDEYVELITSGSGSSATVTGYTHHLVTASEDSETEGKKTITTTDTPYTLSKKLVIKGKYLGSFGNQIRIALRKLNRIVNGSTIPYWNCIVYIESTSGVRTSVENLNFVFDVNNSTDSILHISEIDSKFVTFVAGVAPDSDNISLPVDAVEYSTTAISEGIPELAYLDYNTVTQVMMARLHDGSDLPAANTTVQNALDKAINLATNRYAWATYGPNPTASQLNTISNDIEYISEGLAKLNRTIDGSIPYPVSASKAESIYYREWMFTSAFTILSTLEDKLAYNPNRVIVPGWDDQDFKYILDDETLVWDINDPSPLHTRLMDVAYISRCATAYIDIPRSISRSYIYNESQAEATVGYVQRLARWSSAYLTVEGSYYSSHSAIFAPWGKYTYTAMSKQAPASPSFLALMIDRAMIKNQTSQYEWQLPTTRRHNLKIGKLDYSISKKYLDVWQSLEGVGINCITQIPDLGVTIWGNSTLYEVPPATYQALANLSTRKLVNAVKDLVYRCGIGITFNYNNDQAYNAFYAGMSPLLDTMRNVGAIKDYYIRMSADINGLDNVNANSVVGKIYLVVEGVVNDITVDLIALPPSVDLDQFRA